MHTKEEVPDEGHDLVEVLADESISGSPESEPPKQIEKHRVPFPCPTNITTWCAARRDRGLQCLSLSNTEQKPVQLLATKLSGFKDRSDVLVLALPRGGVPVGFEVAIALHAPLDLFL